MAKSNSYTVKKQLEEFWRKNLDDSRFFMPTFRVHATLGHVESDMVDGFPPRRV